MEVDILPDCVDDDKCSNKKINYESFHCCKLCQTKNESLLAFVGSYAY